MSRRRKLFIGFGVFMLLFGAFYIDTSVYPFTSLKPNFADVERVFNRMQFPADWQEIRSSENRGIGGRQCPIESESLCFHKSKMFLTPEKPSKETFEGLLKKTGCTIVSYTENMPEDGTQYDNYSCSIDEVKVSGTLYKKQTGWEASFRTSSR